LLCDVASCLFIKKIIVIVILVLPAPYWWNLMKMRWVWHEARRRKKINSWGILVGKLERKKPPGKCRLR
jgi:hypothetical protein